MPGSKGGTERYCPPGDFFIRRELRVCAVLWTSEESPCGAGERTFFSNRSMGLLFSKGPEGGESSHTMQLEGSQGGTRGLALGDYRITACAPCQLLTADLGGSKASGDMVGSVGFVV